MYLGDKIVKIGDYGLCIWLDVGSCMTLGHSVYDLPVCDPLITTSPHRRWWELWRRYVRRYICLWTTSWRQFKSDCNRTSSVISLATGDEV